MKSSNVHFSFFRMGKILEGLLAGSVEAEVPHGVECLRDAKHIWERIGGVVDEFRHATFDSVLHAVEDMGSIINDVVVGQMKRGTLLRVDAINIGKDSQVKAGSISSGSDRTKADLRYMMDENGSNLRVLGSILSANKMHIDHHIEIYHDAPETYSRLDWHSACGGKSRTIGTGMLRISNGSKGADAGQIFHNLLLSEKAEADSIPELEVSEHDVVGCGHGTANGPIDEEQMFYLEARGFSPDDAKDTLIAAFLNTTLSEMGSNKLHQWLAENLQDELRTLTT